MKGYFWQDASKRTVYSVPDCHDSWYRYLCNKISRHFGLVPAGELIIGLDEIFQDYKSGDKIVGLEWDIWSGFLVVAKDENAEHIVKEIAEYIEQMPEEINNKRKISSNLLKFFKWIYKKIKMINKFFPK